MTTINRPAVSHRIHIATDQARPISGFATRALAVLRIAFGLTFLWAFFDKLLALGYSTGAITNAAGDRTGIDFFAKDGAWLNGGSPTEGFLSHTSADNPLHGFWGSIAGDAWADWLFMAGLLGVGLALTLGIGMRLAGALGGLLYLFMWVASWPLDSNPVIDEHLTGFIVLGVLALTYAGDTWGLGKIWARTPLVKRYPVLR